MQKIKYSYCNDENGNLIYIKNIDPTTRHACKLYCLQCEQEMVANLGTKKRWYFSHKKDTACDGESYLHELAKRLIREKFLSSDHFPIIFSRDVPCSERTQCPLYTEDACIEHYVKIPSDLKSYNNNILYDRCDKEAPISDFRADLLLTHSSKSDRQPVLIEIYKTHQSSATKLKSNYKIIETKKINSEEDIEDIVRRGFIEGENCYTHNFDPRLPAIRIKDVPIERFVLHKSGKVFVHSAFNDDFACENVYNKYHPQSVIELNMRTIIFDPNPNHMNSSEKGLIYLVKKGMDIRNCIICKYYKCSYSGDNICVLYKKLGMSESQPEQTMAKQCPKYEINPKYIQYPITELEKEIFEVPSQTVL